MAVARRRRPADVPAIVGDPGPPAGAPDRPESYHTVTIRVSGQDGDVRVDLSQDNNKNEAARDEAQRNWKMMLDGLKKVVES